MAAEAARGCGFRKPGFYLVCEGEGFMCGVLPLPLDRCPACTAQVRQTRGLEWVDPSKLFSNIIPPVDHDVLEIARRFADGDQAKLIEIDEFLARKVTSLCLTPGNCGKCPMLNVLNGDKAGLVWVGERFYKTPEDFNRESREQGISRRIPPSVVPDILSHHEKHGVFPWILLAHSKAYMPPFEFGGEEPVPSPGVFRAFRPQRLEQVILDDKKADDADLAAKGITPVYLPANDPDHNPAISGKVA